MAKKKSSEHITLLLAELNKRQERNQKYSLRSFAQSLGLSPSLLSQILRGKRKLTVKTAFRIADSMLFNPDERQAFLHSATDLPEEYLGNWKSYFTKMDPQDFALISDPIYFEILALGAVKGSLWDGEEIAARLGRELSLVEKAMADLEEHEFVVVTESGFKQIKSSFEVSSPVADEGLRNFHKLNLERAIRSLTEVAVEEREFNAITMAISSSKLALVKEYTLRYLENIHSLLDDQSDKDRVYTIAVQVFPNSTGAAPASEV